MSDDPPNVRTTDEIREWIVSKLRDEIGLDPEEIDFDRPLIALGVDSMQFVVMVGELERWLGVRFEDNPLIDYPTVNALSSYLAGQVALGKTVIDPAADARASEADDAHK